MVYQYTRPRKSIAAEYSSPGPCYALPGLVGYRDHDPRSVHQKNPAWHLGIRHGKYKDDAGPGPKYAVNPKIYKDGADGAPHYSIYSRPKDWSLYANPGPGAYSPETADNVYYKKAPGYSLAGRHETRAVDCVPGPNVYAVDPMMGKTVRSGKTAAPNYSLVGRSKIGGFHEDLQKTPGPGNYQVPHPSKYKSNAPNYSLRSRNEMPGDTTRKPGPGAYNPTYNTKRRVGGGYMGIQHSQYRGYFSNNDDCE